MIRAQPKVIKSKILIELYNCLLEGKNLTLVSLKNGTRNPEQCCTDLTLHDRIKLYSNPATENKTEYVCPDRADGTPRIIYRTLPAELISLVRKKGKEYNASINDLLLAADVPASFLSACTYYKSGNVDIKRGGAVTITAFMTGVNLDLLPTIVIMVSCLAGSVTAAKFANLFETKVLNRVIGSVLIILGGVGIWCLEDTN